MRKKLSKLVLSTGIGIFMLGIIFPVYCEQIQLKNGKVVEGEITEFQRIKNKLAEKEKEFQQVKDDYIQAKKEFKKAAGKGFLGFGRTKEEVEKIKKTKKKVIKIKKEYAKVKKELALLRHKFKRARKKNAREEKLKLKKIEEDKENQKTEQEEGNLTKALKYMDIASTHSSLGEAKEAEKYHEKALEANPNLGSYLFDKGVNQYERGRNFEARQNFRKAISLFEAAGDFQMQIMAEEYIDKTLER